MLSGVRCREHARLFSSSSTYPFYSALRRFSTHARPAPTPPGLPHPDDRTGQETPIPPNTRWVLMACELAARQSLQNWVKRLDAKTQHGIQTDAMQAIKGGGNAHDAAKSRTRIGSSRLSSPVMPRVPSALLGGSGAAGESTSSAHAEGTSHPRAHRASSLLRMGLMSPPPPGRSRISHADKVRPRFCLSLCMDHCLDHSFFASLSHTRAFSLDLSLLRFTRNWPKAL